MQIDELIAFIESKGQTEEAKAFILEKRGVKQDLRSLLEDANGSNESARPPLDYSKIIAIVKKHAGKDGISVSDIVTKAAEAGLPVVQDKRDRSRIKQKLKTSGKEHGISLVPDSSTFKYNSARDGNYD